MSFDPKTIKIAFLVIIYICGYNYGLFTPQSLETPLREPPYNLTTLNYQLIFAFTFLIAIIFIVPLGMLMDKIKLEYSVIIIGGLNFIAVMAIGWCFQQLFSGYLLVIYLFRGIFGLTGEGLSIVKNIFIMKYAKESYERLSGIGFFVPPLLYGLSAVTTTHVYLESNSVSLCFYIGGAISFLSVIAGLTIIKIYIQSTKFSSNQLEIEAGQLQFHISQQNQVKSNSINNQQDQEEMKNQQENVNNPLSWMLWILVLANFLGVLTYVTIFQNIHDILVRCYGFTYEQAGNYITIAEISFFIIAISMSQFSQRWAEYRRNFLLILSIVYCISYFLLYYLPLSTEPTFLHYLVISVYVFLLALTFNASLFLYQFIMYVMEEHQVGLGMSFLTGVGCFSQFIGSALSIYVLNGKGVDELPQLYNKLELIFGFISILPIILYSFMMRGQFIIFNKTMNELSMQKLAKKINSDH